MNELEDETVLAELKEVREQVAGLHEVLEAILSCLGKDEVCCDDEGCGCSGE
jgi:hypothetical protein|tara:strand:+ start:214 stop:369 length:156 start_codon:yes stop_codon:yes gene_type:complete